MASWRVEHQRAVHSVTLSQYAGVPSPNRKTKQMVDQGCILRKTVYRNETSCRTDWCLPFRVKIRAWRLWIMDTECQATGAGAKLFQYWEPVDHRHLSTYRIFRSLLHLARSTPTEKKSGYCTHSGFFLRILPLTVSFLVFSPITYRLNVSSGFKLRRTIVSTWKRSLSFWHPNSLRQEPRPLLSLWRVAAKTSKTRCWMHYGRHRIDYRETQLSYRKSDGN